MLITFEWLRAAGRRFQMQNCVNKVGINLIGLMVPVE